jgi:hypothetical protein
MVDAVELSGSKVHPLTSMWELPTERTASRWPIGEWSAGTAARRQPRDLAGLAPGSSFVTHHIAAGRYVHGHVESVSVAQARVCQTNIGPRVLGEPLARRRCAEGVPDVG